MNTTHEWICDTCGKTIAFGQPELPQNDLYSEQNYSQRCPSCGEEMYFDETEDYNTNQKTSFHQLYNINKYLVIH